jgi:AraC-like DNA-binding protein
MPGFYKGWYNEWGGRLRLASFDQIRGDGRTLMNWLGSFLARIKYSRFRRRFYRKSFAILLIAICIPTLIVGIGVKWIGTKQLERIVLDSRDYQVMQAVTRVDEYLSYLERAATQWAFNPEFGSKLRSLENSYDYTFIRNIYTNLLLLQESNTLIGSVYLYLDQPGVVFSGIEGTVQLDDVDKGRFRELLSRPNATYWLSSFEPPKSRNAGVGMITLVYQLPADIARPAGALLIYLDPKQVSRMLGGSALDENGATFLFDETGLTIGSSTEMGGFDSIESEMSKLIHGLKQTSGSRVHEQGKEKYLVAYSVINRLGQSWTHVTVDSLQKLNSPVIAASNFVFMVGFAGLLVGIAMAAFVSRTLYRPIQTLMKMFNTHPTSIVESDDELGFISEQWRRVNFERKTLNERLEQQLPTMKEGFLLQLLQGRFQYSKQTELVERLKLFGWDVSGMKFALFCIHIHGASQSKGRFREEDQELIAFAAVNIAEEIVKDSPLKGEIINFHDLSIGVLLGGAQSYSKEALRNELHVLAEQLVHSIHRFLDIDTTLCISGQVHSVVEIPTAWDEAKLIVRYRNLDEARQVLDTEDFLAQRNPSIPYPFATESEILFAIRSLNEEEAYQALTKFCTELRANTAKEFLFQQGMLQLYGNLQFGFLKAGYNPFETVSFHVQEEMEKVTDTREIADLFHERIIKPFIHNIRQDSEKQDVRIKQSIDRIIETIHAEYDSDLSLDMLAEEHQMTPLMLSKSFKKWTGVNFIHYLTDIRINKSKWLLVETDYKINDIAEMVGYQPTYFNRIFKKSEGVTPSHYREMRLKSSQDLGG